MRNPSIMFLLYLRFSRYVTASTTMKPSRYLTNIWSLTLCRQKIENEENQQKSYRKEKGSRRENSQKYQTTQSLINEINSPRKYKNGTTSIVLKCYQHLRKKATLLSYSKQIHHLTILQTGQWWPWNSGNPMTEFWGLWRALTRNW